MTSIEIRTKSGTRRLLLRIHVIAWMAYIVFMVEAGAYLASYAVGWVNPEAVKHKYKGLECHPGDILEFTEK